jgi:hypothetical protein
MADEFIGPAEPGGMEPWSVGDVHSCPWSCFTHIATEDCATLARRWGDRTFVDRDGDPMPG